MTNLDPAVIAARFGPRADVGHLALTGEHGVVLPTFTDHHVHLALFAEHALAARGIAGVVALGGAPYALARRDPHAVPRPAYAGAFLTTPGGYPTGRPWAPDAIVRHVTDPSRHPGVAGGAATAVDEQIECGARVIKVALNAEAGPTPEPPVLEAIVAHAHDRGVPVVAHVQGTGMFARALDAGIDALAHTPFTEILDEADIARAVTAEQIWISTLDIHRDTPDLARTAETNLARFHAAGGRERRSARGRRPPRDLRPRGGGIQRRCGRGGARRPVAVPGCGPGRVHLRSRPSARRRARPRRMARDGLDGADRRDQPR